MKEAVPDVNEAGIAHILRTAIADWADGLFFADDEGSGTVSLPVGDAAVEPVAGLFLGAGFAQGQLARSFGVGQKHPDGIVIRLGYRPVYQSFALHKPLGIVMEKPLSLFSAGSSSRRLVSLLRYDQPVLSACHFANSPESRHPLSPRWDRLQKRSMGTCC